MRRAEPALAIRKFAEKRRKVREYGVETPGTRELATLLYAAAWAAPSDSKTNAYAAEALTLLPSPDCMLATLGPDLSGGNDSAVYLLRALAPWAWRAVDGKAAERLVHYSDYSRALLESGRDPGPPGFVIWYLNLHHRNQGVRTGFPSLDEAEAGLDTGNYWLELAVLCALSGRREKAGMYLDRFEAIRRETVKVLDRLPEEWGLGASWRSVERRVGLERETLLSESPVLPDRLVSSGLLPL